MLTDQQLKTLLLLTAKEEGSSSWLHRLADVVREVIWHRKAEKKSNKREPIPQADFDFRVVPKLIY